jgi:hypothetical protein
MGKRTGRTRSGGVRRAACSHGVRAHHWQDTQESGLFGVSSVRAAAGGMSGKEQRRRSVRVPR